MDVGAEVSLHAAVSKTIPIRRKKKRSPGISGAELGAGLKPRNPARHKKLTREDGSSRVCVSLGCKNSASPQI